MFDYLFLLWKVFEDATVFLIQTKVVGAMKGCTVEQIDDMVEKFSDYDIFVDTFFLQDYSEEDEFGDWKIKIMITEVMTSSSVKLFRRIISPVLQTTSHFEFGWFHTSIVIGPYYLEWTTKGLTFPKKIMSKGAIAAFDLGTIEPSKDVLKKIAKIIYKWNTTRIYNTTDNNCQHFSDEILKEINVDIEKYFSGNLGKYMNQLRKGKTCSMEYQIPKEYQSELKLSYITFLTHSMLDDFVRDLIKLDSKFEKKHPTDYQLLKAFDRAFWLRYYSTLGKETEMYNIVSPCKKGCIFDDPQTTNSFVKEKK